jgi:hypothetical protein
MGNAAGIAVGGAMSFALHSLLPHSALFTGLNMAVSLVACFVVSALTIQRFANHFIAFDP